ncbi:MAG: hypothetical protein AAF135_07230 [Bacteroidota bacterium]
MNQIKLYLTACLLLVGIQQSIAEVNVGGARKKVNTYRVSSDCLSPSASSQLDINNIRCLLHNGGDMWWDLVGDPRYEVPKGSGKNSMFAGSLWIGGVDETGQLRVAAQTYRQSGIDYWPGPLSGGLSGGNASTDQDHCDEWNQMFKINKTEVDAFRADFADGVIDNPQDYPNVYGWPAVGNPNVVEELYTDFDGNIMEAFRPDGTILYAAPFVDVDGDLFYDPAMGDYPDIQGDQAIWWIVNDRGNTHTETGGQPIGVEIHMLAFAFTTANAVNDMTFYRQTVINRSTQTLNETYIGQWADADLGRFDDDYVGCDTTRGLGFCYNGDDDDNAANGYGRRPPAIGIDFFQGPLADPNDGIDNDKDGMIDEAKETIIMSKFVYYNNDFTLIGNPEVAQHYYGYLSGFWKDGTPIVDNFSNGGDGSGYGAQSPGETTNYMFPGDACSNLGWTEANANNPPFDRRFIQSAGPFTLQPGAVNEIVTGVVWARNEAIDNQFGSVCELIKADEVAQALFDNNFILLSGPDAPELDVSEYDQRLLVSWGYPEELRSVRNNFNESYRQADPVLKANQVADSVFEFQGYLIYQLVDGTVGPNELNDPNRARIVAQCDIADGVSTIVNRTVQTVEGFPDGIILDEVMVEGRDEGIFHSIALTKDLFASGSDTRLKNFSAYYYGAIAYAYNETTSDGRNFVPGNRFFQVVSAIPHPTETEKLGTTIASTYGDGIPVTKVKGSGNGGNFVRITPETEAAILQNGSSNAISYQSGASPIEIKIVDPKKVVPKYYKVLITTDSLVDIDIVSEGESGTPVVDSVFAEWMLFESDDENVSLSDPIFMSTYVKRNDGSAPRPAALGGIERVIKDRGISVAVRGVMAAGDTLDEAGQMGIIGGELTFDDPSQAWLAGLPDNDGAFGGTWDWIRNDASGYTFPALGVFDKFGFFQNILGGTFGPFVLSRSFSSESGTGVSPGVPLGNPTNNRQISPADLIDLTELPDIDIVITGDSTKWSRCVVVETSPGANSSTNDLGTGAWALTAKWKDNVDQDGNSQGNRTDENHGLGWFPGYAINVNTGERVNIFFGESEWDRKNNGNDMRWNPTSDFFNLDNFTLDFVGGRHYIYVTNQPYDGCAAIADSLQNGTEKGVFANSVFLPSTGKAMVGAYKHVAWVGIPLVNEGFDITDPTTIPTDARVSLRVRQPFLNDEVDDALPEFDFNTQDIAVKTGEIEVAQEALDNVLVVPNPYYAYSEYETGQLDNRVRITNLPQLCRVTIFTLNGYMVRQFTKDSEQTFLDWDLKNTSGVPVASGMYIIHVDANIGEQKLGEKTIKLFAVLRPIDLDNF